MFPRPKKSSRPPRLWLTLAACAVLLAACSPDAPPDKPASCTDGVKNGGEADVDCGGACAACADGQACRDGPDCASGFCDGTVCAAPSCTDGVRNGDETAPDCGGATCPACGNSLHCSFGTDCASGVCLDGSCDCGDAGGVYVSAAGGDDANAGTPEAPLRSIQAAISCARKVPREIRVAEGVYESSDSSRISLLEGRSLVGGWSADFTQRSPADHVTEIRDTTDTGTTGRSVAVLLSSTSTQTVLDGFTIRATRLGEGLAATALSLAPPSGQVAAATVRNDVIDCGGNPVILLARCIDLGTSGGSIVVRDSTLDLGTSQGTSWGIHGYSVSSVEISGNVMHGGSSAAVIPIDLWVAPAASPIVAANDVRIDAGGEAGVRVRLMSAPATPAVRNNVVVVTGSAVGIEDGAASEISNNTVLAGTGAAIRTGVAGAAIQNNAIVAQPGGTCVQVGSAGAGPAWLRNNDLYGCGSLFVDGAGIAFDTEVAVNGALLDAKSANNISLDPMLDAANGCRPLPGSPLLGRGLDLSPLFQTDKAGAVRTVPWTIGAFQAP